jgi:formylglycine-generating enzyme required for sulfatase activity
MNNSNRPPFIPSGWWPPRGPNLTTMLIALAFVALMPVAGIVLATRLAHPPSATPTPTVNTHAGELTVTPAAKPGSTASSSSASPSAVTSPTAAHTATAKTAATGATPPACTGAGQNWLRPADQMTMACVPAGSFTIGLKTCDFQGCEKEVNGGSVNLPAFWIDTTEVTNAMFQQFTTATGFVTEAEQVGSSEVYGQALPVSGANWKFPQGPGNSIAGLDNYPVVQINWYAANAYCQWAGGRLPSEAEWEKAARGTDGRLWPWGNTPPSAQLVNAADSSLPMPQGRKDQNDGYRYTAPVGSFPAGASPYGVLDMAGNAWEWTRSIYRDYPYKPDDGREVKGSPGAGDKMVLRGASWFDDYGSLRSTLRYGGLPHAATDGLGFRCIYP